MKLFFEKVHFYLITLNKVKLIALFILLNTLNSFSFSMLAYFVTGVGLRNHSISTMGAQDELLIAVVLAPILETVIFQYALIESIRQKIKPLYACFVSATAFALVHCYSVFYFLFAFISGLIFAYLYYLEKSVLKSFLLVLCTHFLYNLLVYLTKFL
ncbi:MAG: CPBP family intramembrane metalloprotease [Pedobacter sp.]|nr:CPBP family intramembrane metalloprotease [Pedobacter sp.]